MATRYLQRPDDNFSQRKEITVTVTVTVSHRFLHLQLDKNYLSIRFSTLNYFALDTHKGTSIQRKETKEKRRRIKGRSKKRGNSILVLLVSVCSYSLTVLRVTLSLSVFPFPVLSCSVFGTGLCVFLPCAIQSCAIRPATSRTPVNLAPGPGLL
jgi:hypothetical protein